MAEGSALSAALRNVVLVAKPQPDSIVGKAPQNIWRWQKLDAGAHDS
jgi:hypothetical protein